MNEEQEETRGEMETEEEMKSEEDMMLQEALVTAIRAPQRGDLEQLLASNLAAAVFAKPLDKIRMILEAFLLLPEEEQLVVAEDEGKIEYIKRLYEIAVSFSNIVELEPPTPYMRGRYAAVSWSFPTTRAHEYLSLFIGRIWFAEGKEELYRQLREVNLNSEESKNMWNAYLRELARWLSSGFAPLPIAEQVKSEFIVKTMPYASQLLREIFKRYISKETWEQMLSIVSGKAKPKAVVQP